MYSSWPWGYQTMLLAEYYLLTGDEEIGLEAKRRILHFFAWDPNGSTQLWSRAAPPVIAGVSVFGALGYVLATFLGYRLLIAIKRSGDIGLKR